MVASVSGSSPSGVRSSESVEPAQPVKTADAAGGPSEQVPAGTAVVATSYEAATAPKANPAKAVENPGPHWSVSLDYENDRMPGKLINLVPDGQRNPGNKAVADDDGYTGGARATATRTNGNRQLVVVGDFKVLTEDGAMENLAAHPHREDVALLAAQLNTKKALGEKTVLYWGVGGGLEVVGDLGGLRAQNHIHQSTGIGRSPDRLQNQYTTGTEVKPVVTAGVGVEHSLYRGQAFQLVGGAEVDATVALGSNALSTLAGRTGLELRLLDIGTVSANVTARRDHGSGQAFAFMPLDRTYLGTELRMDLDGLAKRIGLGVNVTPVVTVRKGGGIGGETTFTMGVVIGSGNRPWLQPR